MLALFIIAFCLFLFRIKATCLERPLCPQQKRDNRFWANAIGALLLRTRDGTQAGVWQPECTCEGLCSSEWFITGPSDSGYPSRQREIEVDMCDCSFYIIELPRLLSSCICDAPEGHFDRTM